jgi:argininosuccinate lyase
MNSMLAIPTRPLEARLGVPASEKLIQFFEQPHLERERRQFTYFIKVDLAHTVMLAEQGILSAEHSKAILTTLLELENLGVENLPIDLKQGSLLFQIEKYLFSQIGEDIGGRMHTGRSRLDQGPTVRRLYKRDQLMKIFAAINNCRSALLTLAGEHQLTIMPGYTCLQHAHPGIFGHYLLSFANKLGDDFNRLAECYHRLNLNPLGGAGLSGTSWPIDRKRTMELLGFNGCVNNSKLVREAYYAAELIGNLAFVMSTLNDLATDLHIWSSYEFSLVEIADEFCGISSIFPQKKNPTALEAIKFAAGEAVTWLASALATFRAEGTGDVVMREVPLVDKAFISALGSLNLTTAVIESIKVNRGRMLSLAAESWSTATSLADEIVRLCGRSFREAHTIVGRVVRIALEQKLTPFQIDGNLIEKAATELGFEALVLDDAIIKRALDVESFPTTRKSQGSINPSEIKILFEDEKLSLNTSNNWVEERTSALANSDQKLRIAINRFTEA